MFKKSNIKNSKNIKFNFIFNKIKIKFRFIIIIKIYRIRKNINN